MIGVIPLAGVRRSEVEPYLTDRLGRYLKNPIIHARALVRISIEGEVEKPGTYAVPTDVVLGDVFMAAGGLTRDAKMSKLKIDRAGQQVMEGDKLQYAVAQGRTVDELGLRAGDRIMVPKDPHHDTESNVRTIAAIITIPIGIFTLGRLTGAF
jgi:protein involved in polysaccharide export with SLBB domain